MRTLIAGIAAAVVLAAIGGFVASSVREPVYRVYGSPSVRLDEPGSNLVGERWTGNPKVDTAERHARTEGRAGSTH